MAIERVAVLGGGLMGSGIAESVARAGLPVTVRDVDDAADRRGPRADRAPRSSAPSRAARSTQAEREAILGRIELTTELADLAGVDLVIEAVPENAASRRKILAEVAGGRRRGDADRLQHVLDPDRPARRRASRAPSASSACTSSARCR